MFDDAPAAAPAGCVVATIDGAARGNPGPAAYGVVFEDASGKVLAQLSARLGKATNNVAEYRALLAALAYAHERGWCALKVRTDSELIARQLQGRYKVKSADLKRLHAAARNLTSKFDYFAVEAVPRKLTRAADKLANAALDKRPVASLSRAKPRDDQRPVKSKTSGNGFSRAEGQTLKERASAPEGQTVRAVYEDGLLKPKDKLDLRDGDEVELQIRRKPSR